MSINFPLTFKEVSYETIFAINFVERKKKSCYVIPMTFSVLNFYNLCLKEGLRPKKKHSGS